jgi:hypothetical protein
MEPGILILKENADDNVNENENAEFIAFATNFSY